MRIRLMCAYAGRRTIFRSGIFFRAASTTARIRSSKSLSANRFPEIAMPSVIPSDSRSASPPPEDCPELLLGKSDGLISLESPDDQRDVDYSYPTPRNNSSLLAILVGVLFSRRPGSSHYCPNELRRRTMRPLLKAQLVFLILSLIIPPAIAECAPTAAPWSSRHMASWPLAIDALR